MFDILMVFLKEFFEKVDFEKNSRRHKCMKNYPGEKNDFGCSLEKIPKCGIYDFGCRLGNAP